MSDETRGRELEDTLREVDHGLRAMRAGDGAPYAALWDESEDTTLFGAWGPIERGHGEVTRTFEWVSSRFGPEGGCEVENVVVHRSGDLACTVGFERGDAMVDGGEVRPMTIRVTHLYRHTGDRWRLVHRHADFPPPDQRLDT
jgi:ketosteroid isomerase-like protein